ncbi:MAG TPA: sigma-70 family RNA polymerase sigma factor [Kouleothrix sp.]|uniref:RNA polymerase sigma factor n=1 Tax=Kouleothrix sp. TaxID=2779161 RepID=UPI002D0F36C3|nr:sigma-70 family RNA polymerase sigma factor [Kouleothrix sp.]HRC74651.1 sigma-70 family RNA polymerase sigma factor [Kouleothrix sp.]
MVSESELELPKIIAQAQRGDAGAFGDLYAKYAGLILRYLYVRVRDQEGAQDLTQEVFVRVIKGIGGFEYRGEKSFLGWLYTIANNVLIGQARRKRAISTPLDENIELVDPRGQDEVLSIYDRVALQQAISQLTQDQQQVLTLKFFADMTNNEIAVAIGRTEGAVKALQHRALQSLQQLMARENQDLLATREVGGESWSGWDEPFRSRTVGIDDLNSTDRH